MSSIELINLLKLNKLLNTKLQLAKDVIDHRLMQKLRADEPTLAYISGDQNPQTDVLAIKEYGPADLFACGKDMLVRGFLSASGTGNEFV